MNQMFRKLDADIGVSISDLKRNPAAVMRAAEEQAVAVLSHNRVVGYVVAPRVWEYAQDLHDDAKIVDELQALGHEEPVPVKLDEL